MIRSGRSLRGTVTYDADAVVVGTGAGGGMALRELSRAGLRVIALEEGAFRTSADFDQREEHMLSELFQDGGARTTRDLAIRVLMGRGVGGSTVHNTNLCKRTPPELLDLWGRKYAVSGCSERELAPVFDEVERDLSVSEIAAERRNVNNRMLERGVTALGWRGGPLRHNRVGCRDSGFCELGCSYDAKQNALKILIPQALVTGNAEVLADVRATLVRHAGGRVTGVRGVALDGLEPVATVEVNAPIVVLSGAAAGSPALAIQSALPDPHAQQGRGLRLHPGGVVAGLFDERIDGFSGIPQSYECTEWLDLAEGSDRRAWITTVFAHPIGTAASMPGFGAAHMALMRNYAHLGVLTAMVHDETEGRVRVASDGAPVLDYEMQPSDVAQLALGLRACARILLAAGAREVVLPAIPPIRITREADIDAITPTVCGPHALPLTAVHPMGSMRMGDDPKRAAVTSQGEHHHVRGLFVLDGSLFPTSLGAPPQLSIYTFAKHFAKHVIARAKSL